jgi:cardiolipin synthase A/B
MERVQKAYRATLALCKYLTILTLCCWLTGCDLSFNVLSAASNTTKPCQSNCTLGNGVRGLRVLVEPNAGPTPLVDAISSAQKSVKLEIYLLSNHNIIRALEEDANRGIEVRVILEPHPYGSDAVSVSKVLDELQAAGVQAQYSNPTFALTHEKGMLIDNSIAYIMTSNFTNSALGTGKYAKNREYDIIDTNMPDVQAVAALFQADWNHNLASFNNTNLVVSPINARNDFSILIGNARHMLLIETEEMNDSNIEQTLISAAQHGVQVQVILPAPSGSSDSNSSGIATLTQGGISVREDPHLYMHAKMLVVDGQQAFVGSENFSAQSLDQNRELGIIVADSSVLSTLLQTFQEDWNASQKV